MSWIIAGVGSFVFGLFAFFLLPFIGAVTGWNGPSKFMFFLAKTPITRLAILVSESNDIVARPMTYDGAIGAEIITIDGQRKEFGDPAGRLHNWLGMRFALADEETGTLFDPRDAVLGQEKQKHEERNETEFVATDSEYDDWGVQKWLPGAFTLPDGYQLADLSAASALVDGGERAEYPSRVKSIYEHAMNALHGGRSASELLRLAFPMLVAMGVFGGIWILSSQFGGAGGGGGGGGSTVGFGSVGVLMAISPRGKRAAKAVAGGLLGIGIVGGLIGALYVTFGFFAAIIGAITLPMGFLAVPVLAQLGRISPVIGAPFSNMFFKLGFTGYRRPVFVWTPARYEVREYDDLDDVGEPTWYGIFGQTVGFTFEGGQEVFGEAGVDNDTLRNHSPDAVTDGGRADTNVAREYDRVPELGPDRAGVFIPSKMKDYCVNTNIARGWWTNSADGQKSMRTLLQAKEEFGGDEPNISDKTIMYLSTAAGFVAGIAGVVIFVL